MTLRHAFLALAMLIAPAALAQAPPAMLDRYDEAVLKKVIEGQGFKVIDTSVNENGEPAMTVEAGDLAFQVQGEFCKGEGKAQVCQGIQLSAILGDPGGKDLNAIADKFNNRVRAAKVFRIARGLVLERYLIMDHGVPLENLGVNIEVFEEMLGMLWKEVG